MLISGLGTTVIGFGIVFLTLAILSFILNFMKYFGAEKQKEPEISVKPAPEPPVTSIEQEPERIPEQDDQELIAVITAVIAASMNTSADRLRVVSLRRRESNWIQTSRREQHRHIY